MLITIEFPLFVLRFTHRGKGGGYVRVFAGNNSAKKFYQVRKSHPDIKCASTVA